MKTTNNYGLKKPDGADLVNIEDLNYNADIIDAQLATKEGLIKSATDKTSLVDTDTVPLSDSAASNATKKITFANLKASLKTYFDTMYNKYSHPTTAGNKHIPSGGAVNQILKYGGASGTAAWGDAEGAGVGRDLSGQEVSPTEGYTITAGNGAEIFNDYRGRFYNAGRVHFGNVASNYYSHAEGQGTTASGGISHAEGNYTSAEGYFSHCEGFNTTAIGQSSHAEGQGTTADNFASHVQGKRNKVMTVGGAADNTTGDAFVIGNGTSANALSNAFRVTYAGAAYGLSSFNTSGADYAEFFEWTDLNLDAEDRVGYFVTLDGNQIVKANAGDYILGVISGNPCIIGNSDEDWLGRWEHDEFGRFIKEDVDTPVTEWRQVETTETVTLENGETIEVPKHEMEEVETGEIIHGWRYKANPDYDPSQTYVERKDRPEWDCVGMLGVLAVREDGTCQVDGYCQVTNGGTATAAERYVPGYTYRVVKRVTDDVVQIIFK